MPHSNEHNSLQAENLRVAYGDTVIVDDLNLTIPSGQLTALIGPNGSGKSTLLRTLAGLAKPSSGRVLLDGQSIGSLPTKTVARRIGMLAQGPVAPDGITVEEIARQGRYPHRSLFSPWSKTDTIAVDQALAQTDLDDLRGRALSSLSGGQRQRAWLAMVLAQQTDILLLDEPTSYLDLAHQIAIMELAEDLVREHGKTVVAVLHDLNQAARHADHMAVLLNGAIVAIGTPAQVLTAENVKRAYNVKGKILVDPLTKSPMLITCPRQD